MKDTPKPAKSAYKMNSGFVCTFGCQIGQQNVTLTSNLEPKASVFQRGGYILGPQAFFSGVDEQSACSRDPRDSTVSLPPSSSPPCVHISFIPDDFTSPLPVRASSAESFEGMCASPHSPDDAP